MPRPAIMSPCASFAHCLRGIAAAAAAGSGCIVRRQHEFRLQVTMFAMPISAKNAPPLGGVFTTMPSSGEDQISHAAR
jgi:hypothetical protein